ncbi:MAG: ABC transporter permease [Opitutae bacterium]|nr:ABC transporter permease [Opitutae bacterium]
MLRRLAPFAADLFQHRELLWQFTLRNVELRHKGSHLGLLWSVLTPLLMLGLYVLVFGYIFGGSFGVLPHETRADYALAIFLGLAIFQFAAEVLATSPTVIVANPNFVKKVVFPLEILPAANVFGALFHMFISLTLVLVCALFFGRGSHLGVLWLPAILAPLLLFSLGFGWLFAALGVFLRDIGQILQFLSTALMFSSAVFYSAQKIPPAAWAYMRFNPVLLAIELARNALLWERPLDLHHLAYLYLGGFGTCVLGYAAFRRMKPAFADVL